MPTFDESLGGDNQITAQIEQLKLKYRSLLDRVTPYFTYRWSVFGVLLVLFVIRILFAHGWYIICYTLFIYLLSLFIQFLQPKFDMELQQDLKNESIEEGLTEEEQNGNSTGGVDDEFRPFIRRLPEFKFWHRATIATSISLFCSFFKIFNLPVFWPILLMYFIVLFSFSMKKQIQHMIKYHYIPLDIGKAKYGRK